MLISFRCSNYKSFDKDGVLVMTKGGSRSHPNHVADVGQGTLKHAVMYGSNASGKSSLISAMDFSRSKIISGSLDESDVYCMTHNLKRPASTDSDASESGLYCRIHDKENSKKPTIFEYVFAYKGHTFDYGFACILSENKITREWLYILSDDLQSHECVYCTEVVAGKCKLSVGPQFTEEEEKIIHNFSSLLGSLNLHALKWVFGQMFLMPLGGVSHNIKLIHDVYEWFKYHLIINYSLDIRPNTLERDKGPGELKCVTDKMKSIGIEVDSIWTIHQPATPEEIDFINKRARDKVNSMQYKVIVNTVEQTKRRARGAMISYSLDASHELAKKKNMELDDFYTINEDGSINVSFNNGLWFTHASGLVCKASEESMGTQQALRIAPFLLADDLDDVTLVFDEFGTSMHPLVLDNLVRQFQSKNATKTNQLICVTHYTTLLTEDLFRRDEIWFVDKTDEGSEIYSLDQFENNSDGSVSEDYLTGRFGALPVFRS